MLQSLELFGFKSFADRTRFDFAAGITGVVGPNGSGKSNVVDAIKWILGDQSPKSLRGSEMTDVIFNGAASRKASGFAEATLTFDNASGFLAIESQQVQVGRRLWRNGDAEYLINNAPARLRDVRELLMGTGAGSAAYSIIEQGRVDQILQANATARRQVFEEAAGISLYKSRRTDAQRRLQRVEQNLQRLADIVDEVEARLNATRSQASKAAKYRELSTELRELWLGLAADEHRHFSSQIETIDAVLAHATTELESLNRQQAELQTQLAAVDAEMSEVDERMRQIERESGAVRETDARHESNIRHESARLKELEADVARLRKQRSTTLARVREVTRELDHHTGVLEQAVAEFEAKQSEVARHEEEQRRLTSRLESQLAGLTRQKQDRDVLAREMAAAAQRMARVESEIAAANGSADATRARLDQIDDRIEQSQAERARREEAVRTAAEFLSRAEERIRGFRTERDRLAGEQDSFQRTLAEQREERSALTARKIVLEDLESRQEGLSIGVRDILQRAKTCHYSPWNQVLGSAADLLEVDLEHAGLLEVALGTRAQLIVVGEFESLVDYLTMGACQIAGRVGFLPRRLVEGLAGGVAGVEAQRSPLPGAPDDCDTQAGGSQRLDPSHPTNSHRKSEISDLESPDLVGLPGVRNRLDRLVRSSDRVPRLAEHLLKDTWVVETLEAAMALASGAGRGCRFVTLQGELLEADGSLTVGSVRGEPALVSRKSELRRIKNDLLRLDFRIEEEERRIAGLIESLSGVDTELSAATTEMRTLADRHAELRAELSEVDRDLERVRNERAAAESALAELLAAIEEDTAELEVARADSADLSDDRTILDEEIAESERLVAETEQHVRQVHEQRNADRLELARHEERVRNMRASMTRIQGDLQQRRTHAEESSRRLETIAAKLREVTLQLLNNAAERNELAVVRERLDQKAAGITVERLEVKSRRATLMRQEVQLRTQARATEDRRHDAEIRRRDIDNQVGILAARIHEEYQLTLEEVAASGASAVAIYRDELRRTLGVAEAASVSVNERESSNSTDDSEDDGASDSISFTEIPLASGADAEERGAGLSPRNVPDRDPADEGPSFAEIRTVLDERVNRLRRKLKNLGNVNTDSLRDLDELEARHDHLRSQLQDLVEAKNALDEIIRRINLESRRLFLETFDQVRVNFQKLFRRAFGGGDGDVVLEDPNEVLDCGIDIVARPPGKDLKSITLMSGGEKTLTAFALLLAIFQCRPSPYCVLDEVDAALDEANVERLTSLLTDFEQIRGSGTKASGESNASDEEHSAGSSPRDVPAATQFILVTHKKPTMSICDALYGVTMEQAGVSKRVSVRFEDVSETGEISTAAKQRAA